VTRLGKDIPRAYSTVAMSGGPPNLRRDASVTGAGNLARLAAD
jgi:hypothetical protein